MTRSALLGGVAFGVTAAVVGYIWVGFEFPFAILLPAAIGLFAAIRPHYAGRCAWLAALVGGVAFTAAFLGLVFLALADGSVLALPAWAGALLAAAIAGAATGALLAGRRGAFALSLFSAGGMIAGVAIAALLRAIAPSVVDTAGTAQSLYFALVIGLVGAAMGASVGAGVAWIHRDSARDPARSGGGRCPSVTA